MTKIPNSADDIAVADVHDDTVAQALLAGLSQYELADEDATVLAVHHDDASAPAAPPRPVIAVVGRPNVGKSTLVNRIIGRREAVVQDVPGVTRDRVRYSASWAGRDFVLIDTGGWLPAGKGESRKGLAATVAEQAEIATELADVIIMVVDAKVGATDVDEAVVRMLRRSGKPVVLAANKVDDLRHEGEATALWNLGLGEPYPVSALHGRGSGDLLDVCLDFLPAEGSVPDQGVLPRVALIGRPNVGKSSLLNAFAGADRVVVDATAGTTRDPVDEVVTIDGDPWLLVDTAGLRRKTPQSAGAEFYAGLRTAAAVDKAEVAVVVLDASQELSEQDIRLVQLATDAGRALVIAYNKWDLVDDERRYYLDREYERDLAHVAWAPRVNVSALTHWHVQKLAKHLRVALDSWKTRVSTGQLNALIAELAAAHPHPVRSGKQPRILYATQADARPPRFILFTTGKLDAGYVRFIERRIRETFGFSGTPIEISVRPRLKRAR